MFKHVLTFSDMQDRATDTVAPSLAWRAPYIETLESVFSKLVNEAGERRRYVPLAVIIDDMQALRIFSKSSKIIKVGHSCQTYHPLFAEFLPLLNTFRRYYGEPV